MSTKIYRSILLPFFILFTVFGNSQNPVQCDGTGCDVTIPFGTTSWSGASVTPGSTVCIEADANGERSQLTITDLYGQLGNEIIIRPCDQLITISPSGTGINFCLDFIKCDHFILTGTGIPNQEYGIILDTDGGTSSANGISCKQKCSDFTIENIEIKRGYFSNNSSVGILSNPQAEEGDMTTWGEYTGPTSGVGFTQYNVVIRNNYIHHLGGEGMYIGSSSWDIQHPYQSYLYEDPQVKNIDIYNNRCEYIGLDAIQISSATGINHIYDNNILFNGQSGNSTQSSGIWLGGGTRSANVYNNLINRSLGIGIGGKPYNSIRLFNNVIIKPGKDESFGSAPTNVHGIWFGYINSVNDNIDPNAHFYAYNNTVINPKTDGIKLSSSTPANFDVINNIIAKPGSAYVNFENANTSYEHHDDFNLKTANLSDPKFVDVNNDNFMIKPSSPAYNTGSDNVNLTFDFNYIDRPQCPHIDIGAYEYESALSIWGNCYIETDIQARVILDIDLNIKSGSIIGAFYKVNGELKCGGLLDWACREDTMIVYGQDSLLDGFADNEEFTWIVWKKDYEENHIYFADYDTSFEQGNRFQENGISKLNKLYDLQEIVLDSGWNIFSTYIEPFNDSIEQILSGIENNVVRVEDYTDYYTPNPYHNSLLTIETGKAYKIKMNQTDTLIIKGIALRPEKTPIPLVSTIPEWNLLGYLLQNDHLVEPILDPIINHVNIIKDENGIIYWPLFNINYLVNLKTGEGYEIQMNNADTLLYPPNDYSSPAKSQLETTSPKYLVCNLKTNNNLSLGIPVDSWENRPMKGDEIGIYNQENNLVGSGVFQNRDLAITVWGSDPSAFSKDGLMPGEEFTLRLLHIANGEQEILSIGQWLVGNNYYQRNGIAVTGKINRPENSINPFYLSQNYPNPFRNTSTISYYLPHESWVKIQVRNSLGDLCEEYFLEKQSVGIHYYTFNLKNKIVGNYSYTLITSSFLQTKKMCIIE